MAATVARPGHRRWSTADVDSRHALEYWTHTIRTSFLEIEIDSQERNPFYASLDQSRLGPATMHCIETGRQSIRRTSAQIADSHFDGYFLTQVRAGQRELRQYDRSCWIDAGDCVLIDCAAPYRLECLTTARCLVLYFPRDWLRNWLPNPEILAGRALQSGSGWGTALCAALSNLDAESVETLALPGYVVADQIAALLALAAGPLASASPRGQKLLDRIRGTLRDRCHEAHVTPDSVANEHGISKRYLHYLFAQAGSTFGGELIRLRLECAHRLLSDSRYASLTVTEIFWRCGFQGSSHFARRFREAYGVGPSEFRAARSRPAPRRRTCPQPIV